MRCCGPGAHGLVELQERARTLERTREEEARRRVAEDRLQIARDLHDGVAHTMTTINVQAGAAAHVMDRHPEAAKDALVAIRRASGDVLDELTAMVALLREGDQPPDLVPTPGVHQIADLVRANARRRGRRHAHGRRTSRRGPEAGRDRGVPHRAGVADQRVAPRARDHRPGPAPR